MESLCSDGHEGPRAEASRSARHRRRHQRCGHRARRGGAGTRRPALREGRPRLAHLVGQHQADPRRTALPGAARFPPCAPLPPGARGAAAQRPAHHLAAALRAPAPRRASTLVDDPAGPACLRPPGRARPVASQHERRSLPAREWTGAEEALSAGIRVLRLLGAGRTPGGAERSGRALAGGGSANPHRVREARAPRRALGSDAGRQDHGDALPGRGEGGGQRERAVGGQDPRPGDGRRYGTRRQAREGKPHRRRQDVRAPVPLHLPGRRRPRAVRDPLRGGFHAARYHGRGDRRGPGAGRNHPRGDRLHLHGGQCVFRDAARARGRRVVLRRHPSPVRRSGAQCQRGHPRLRAASRPRAGADALGLRRQDHDLPPARRAGGEPAGRTNGFRRAGLDPRCSTTRRGHSRRGRRGIHRAQRRAPFLASGATPAPLRAPLRHRDPCAPRRMRRYRRSRRALRSRTLRGRGRAPGSARVGPGARGRPVAAYEDGAADAGLQHGVRRLRAFLEGSRDAGRPPARRWTCRSNTRATPDRSTTSTR